MGVMHLQAPRIDHRVWHWVPCSIDAHYMHTPSCPLQYEYLWADGVKYKKPVRLSAPEYIDKLFDWIEVQVSNV